MRANLAMSILTGASAALMCLSSGCDGCGCDKAPEVLSVKPAAPVVVEGIKGLPAAAPEQVVATPDSPDDVLAGHYGIDVGEIKRLRELHSKLPGIVRPTAAQAPQLKPKTKEELGELPIDRPVPYSSHGVMAGADRVTDLPAIKVILGHQFTAQNIIPSQDIAAEIDRLRRLVFNLKIPVFAEPVVLIDSKLDKPGAEMSMTVGFPVPADFKVLPGLKVRTVKPGKCVYTSRMNVNDITLTDDGFKMLSGGAVQSLIGAQCDLTMIVDLDGTPKPADVPSGEAYFYCL